MISGNHQCNVFFKLTEKNPSQQNSICMLLESEEHGSPDDNDFISDWISSEPVPFVKNV